MKAKSEIQKASERLIDSLLREIGAADVALNSGRSDSGFVARWQLENRRQELEVAVRPRFSHASFEELLSAGERPQMMIAPRLGPEARKLMRARAINHADFSGVAYLRLPGVLIDRDRVERDDRVRWQRSSQEANPFSKKASRVLRALLANRKQPMTVTEIASRTGLAVGWAFGVAEAIVRRGYATQTDAGVLLTDPVAAIIDWTRAYSWRRNTQRSYRVPLQRNEIIEQLRATCGAADAQWGLTLLAAAERRVGFIRDVGPIHLYFSPNNDLAVRAVLDRLYAEESPADGELILLDPYYGPSTYVESIEEGGVKAVSDLQLFLDLVGFPVRGLEVAEVLLRSRMAKTLALSSSDVSKLMEAVG